MVVLGILWVFFYHVRSTVSAELKGGAHTCWIDVAGIHASKHVRMILALHGSSTLQHFKCNNTIEIYK